jgi:hypothetical protein
MESGLNYDGRQTTCGSSCASCWRHNKQDNTCFDTPTNIYPVSRVELIELPKEYHVRKQKSAPTINYELHIHGIPTSNVHINIVKG